MIFKSNELVKNLMAKTTTKKGLRVFANILVASQLGDLGKN